jgi:hypothetical protein
LFRFAQPPRTAVVLHQVLIVPDHFLVLLTLVIGGGRFLLHRGIVNPPMLVVAYYAGMVGATVVGE